MADEDTTRLARAVEELDHFLQLRQRIEPLAAVPMQSSRASEALFIAIREYPRLEEHLLKVCSSGYFSRADDIDNTRAAIDGLGVQAVRDLAVCLTVIDRVLALQRELALDEAGWADDLFAATIAEFLSYEIQSGLAERAFVVALLRGIGAKLIAINQALHERMAEGVMDFSFVLAERLDEDEDKEVVTHLALKHWRIPAELCNGLLGAQLADVSREPGVPVSRIVNLAYELALAGSRQPRRSIELLSIDRRRWEVFGLDPDIAHDLIWEVRGQLPKVTDLFLGPTVPVR